MNPNITPKQVARHKFINNCLCLSQRTQRNRKDCLPSVDAFRERIDSQTEIAGSPRQGFGKTQPCLQMLTNTSSLDQSVCHELFFSRLEWPRLAKFAECYCHPKARAWPRPNRLSRSPKDLPQEPINHRVRMRVHTIPAPVRRCIWRIYLFKNLCHCVSVRPSFVVFAI